LTVIDTTRVKTAVELAPARPLLAELLGCTLLAAVVVGSGIAAVQLSPDDVGLQLLENAAATGAGLFAIILMLGPVSGAHLNPVVTLVDAGLGGLPWRTALAYVPVQVIGCILGTVLANVMYEGDPVSISATDRVSAAHVVAEVVATAGLVLLIFSLVRSGRVTAVPAAVGAYIAAAYFFTSSTSFANPAITVGRMFSDTFAGIAVTSAPGYIAAQLVGGVVGYGLVRLFYPSSSPA
jgi:arsenate reductase